MFFSGMDQTKYSLDKFMSHKTINLTEACVSSSVSEACVNIETSLQTLLILHFLTTWLRINTEKHSFTSGKMTLGPFLRTGAEKAAAGSLYCVWFSLVFGLAFLGIAVCFWLFVCLFFLPRQSVSLSNKNLEAKFSQYFFQPPDKNL